MEYSLPKGFELGATGAAWQMEGEFDKDENHNHFPHLMYNAYPERWHNGLGPTKASDFYNRYKEDIKLFKKVGLKQYRFNIDWSRFIEDFETGKVNEKAYKFYDDVVNRLIEEGIEPIICLEHWELPEYYYKKYDGYASRKVVDMYVKYAEEVFKRFSGRVKKWFTFNEPIVIPQLCFMDGFWWPYVTDTKRGMEWIHGKILCNALAIKKFKELKIDGKIGIILNPSLIYERTKENAHDLKAKEIADSLLWGAFMDTAVKGEYPKLLFDILEKEGCMFTYNEQELKVIKENTVDMLGINYYQPMRVKAPEVEWNQNTPFNFKKYFSEWDMPGKRMNPYRGWEIYPKALYDVAMRIKEDYGNIEWFVAESGMGVEGEDIYKNESGEIQDDYRIDFIKEHLAWLIKAIEDGANCKGYWLFASLDNCSPLNAFKNRYGLIEVNLNDNRNRKIKKSGKWYKEVTDTRKFDFKDINKTSVMD